MPARKASCSALRGSPSEGKGRSAWVKPVTDGWSIVINDVELKGHLVGEGGRWAVAAFSDDRRNLATLDMPPPKGVADALLVAEYLTNMLRAKEELSRLNTFHPGDRVEFVNDWAHERERYGVKGTVAEGNGVTYGWAIVDLDNGERGLRISGFKLKKLPGEAQP
jgi:hypothetical protein